ncbi:Hypothetical predicted protein [Pelobates cultripes]|uniref:Uncharacterized protein n=1 Tax=Pelobates cultripes TaxID=61616 RepID=A0AAD1TAW3_PELCU|nr:Hypothetical predicted protein [Pelobates cultripes]
MEDKYCLVVFGFDARLQDVLRNMEYLIPEEDLNEIRPFWSEEILTTNKRQGEQLELLMPYLGNQPSEELVWLDDSYTALCWHAYHFYPWLIDPGLLWETMETSLWFGEADIARFWSIRAERADNWNLTEIDAIPPDLSFLANWEWELEQDYVCLFQRATPPVSDMMGCMNFSSLLPSN